MLSLADNLKFSQETHLELEDGETLFCEGDEGREMYVVTDGEMIVTRKSVQGSVVLATLKKGDFVGEMSLLESLPRSATATAKGKVRLLVIQPGGFLLKIRRDPTFAFEMLQALSRRIRKTNEALLSELNKDNASIESMKTILQVSEYEPEASSSAPRLVK